MPGAVPAFLQPSINVLNFLKPQFPGDPSKALSSLGFRLFPGSLGRNTFTRVSGGSDKEAESQE